MQQRKRPGRREALIAPSEAFWEEVPQSQAYWEIPYHLVRFLEALSPIYMSHPCQTLMTLNGFMLIDAAPR